MLASVAFCYTAIVSVVSMGVAAFFADTVHFIVLGHIVVLVLFVGGGRQICRMRLSCLLVLVLCVA